MNSPVQDHTQSEVFVSLRNVTFHYGKVTALDDVSLDLPAGVEIEIKL